MVDSRESSNRLESLTGLRGFAILIVLLSHFYGRDMGPVVGELSFHGAGRFGIYVFFVLSAFLCHESFRSNTTKDYFLKRFFRIAPAYYVVCSLVLLLGVTLGNDGRYLHINGSGVLHYLFIRGDGVFWTLPTEVFYYLLIPLLAAMATPIFLILASVMMFCWYVLSVKGLVPPPLLVMNHHGSQFAEVFLLGSAAYYFRNHSAVSNMASNRFLGWALLALFVIGVISMMFVFPFGIENPIARYSRGFTLLWAAVCAATVLALFHGNSLLTKVFSQRYLKVLGTYAFSLYLTHMASLQIANSLEAGLLVRMIIAIGSLAIFSYVLQRYVETAGIELGRRVIRLTKR